MFDKIIKPNVSEITKPNVSEITKPNVGKVIKPNVAKISKSAGNEESEVIVGTRIMTQGLADLLTQGGDYIIIN